MPTDARKDPRTKISEAIVRYTSATVEEFIENHAHDVSKGGMFLRSTTPFAKGTLVSFELRLADEQAVVAGVGRVIWMRAPQQGEGPPGMGIKFIDIDEPSQAIIDRLLAAKDGPGELEMKPATIDPPRPGGRPAAPSGKVAAAEPLKTVLGLGSVVKAPPPSGASALAPATPLVSPVVAVVAAGDVRARTQLGIAPPALTPEEAARVKTRMGIAPAVTPAGLVLAQQSEPIAGDAPRAISTSEIDAEWLPSDAAKTAPGDSTQDPPAVGGAVPLVGTLDGGRATPAAGPEWEGQLQPTRAKSERPKALNVVDGDDDIVLPRARRWPLWLLFFAAILGVAFYFRVPLHRAGVVPAVSWIPGLADAPVASSAPPASASAIVSAADSASAAAYASALAAASASAAPSASSAASAPVASASAAPSASTSARAAASAAAAASASAAASARAAASASLSAAHAAAAKSAHPGPKPPPKPKPAVKPPAKPSSDENPY